MHEEAFRLSNNVSVRIKPKSNYYVWFDVDTYTSNFDFTDEAQKRLNSLIDKYGNKVKTWHALSCSRSVFSINVKRSDYEAFKKEVDAILDDPKSFELCKEAIKYGVK